MEKNSEYPIAALFAGLLFFASGAFAQMEDLNEVCGQATTEMICQTISAQVSASAPPGVDISCGWTGTQCVANIVVDDSLKNPGTKATDLRSACSAGAGSQSVCDSITAGIAEADAMPEGITVECVWQNPGASSACSPRVTLQTSMITSRIVGGFIKSMEFLQGGTAKTSIRVMSDPFEPYVIHTVIDGSSFPGGRDSDTWMTVTATKDVTPGTFDFDSIDPAAMAAAEQDRLKALFSGDGPTEIGPGIGPDFTVLKQLQTFNWSMTIPYDTTKNFTGTAQCNGTYNDTLDKCMNGAQEANWIKMPLCTNPSSCPAGSYLKDVPSAGYLTIFNADPVPVYRTKGTNTTTTTSTTSTSPIGTTTTTLKGSIAGDANGDGHVNYADLLLIASSYGRHSGDYGYDPRADLSGDGRVDYADLLLLATNYGR